jgi:hypothetical protein
MRRAVTLLALATLLLGSLTSDVALADIAYTDTGIDPDDTSGASDIADVAFTRRSVWSNANGRRWITVRVRAYEPLGSVWEGLSVFLDYRGDRRRDARISIQNLEGPPYCDLRIFPSTGWIAPAQQVNRTISCSFKLRLLNPTKRIRWRILSPDSEFIDSSVIDRAPDTGWFV